MKSIMTDEKMLEVQDDSLGESDEDKTSEEEKNEVKKAIDELPSEDEDLRGEKKEEKKVDHSEVAQKIKYREKLRETREELAQANEKIAALEQRIGTSSEKSGDEKELAAQKYIRDLARIEAEKILKEREDKEAKEVRDFEESVDNVLDDNPEITRNRLLEVIEEFDVSPEIAAKIIQKASENTEKKPKMPAPKRGSTGGSPKKVDDKGKSFFEVAREVISEYKDKFSS